MHEPFESFELIECVLRYIFHVVPSLLSIPSVVTDTYLFYCYVIPYFKYEFIIKAIL